MSAHTIKLFADAHVFDGKYQGTRTFINEIYAVMAGKPGIELYLGAYDTKNLKKHFPGQNNIHFIKYRSRSGLVRLLYDIPSIIKRYGIDYAHFQYMAPPIKNCRFIVTIHDVIFNEYPGEFSLRYRLTKNRLYRAGALKADILTTVSEYSRRSIEKYLKINTAHTVITPNGVAQRFFDPYNKQQSQQYIKNKFGPGKYILFVSRLEPRKNHMLLLNAWLRLQLYAKGYHLVFLGHTTLHVPELEETINGLPADIREFIFLHDSVDDADLLEFYRAASVFVYPSKAEGFGIPPLEAAALQIPVICSNTSAMSDFSFFGEMHIDPANEALLTGKLEQLITNPPGDAYLSRLSGIIKQQYSWTQSAENLYNSIVNDKNIIFEKEIKKSNR
jgi:glycosyltransferase involved in cell wall biosynthesis